MKSLKRGFSRSALDAKTGSDCSANQHADIVAIVLSKSPANSALICSPKIESIESSGFGQSIQAPLIEKARHWQWNERSR
jgi:hypothetical protein